MLSDEQRVRAFIRTSKRKRVAVETRERLALAERSRRGRAAVTPEYLIRVLDLIEQEPEIAND